ncbi:MAG TPA: LytTR family DNA-binding domain-containing protein, partial [Gemmatimonadaceae bacterium]|nr:LytTR family DNA-binding domain-containing protein [Gemmatimonadaceae bacterium]
KELHGEGDAAPRHLPHLVARVGARDVIIALETVDYIQADDVYAAVVTGGRRLLVRTALDALEQSLDPVQFARVHRSYIVRLDRVAEVRRGAGDAMQVVLRSGVTLPVSRRRRYTLGALLSPFAT